jgi:hypothetical protein
MGGFPWLEEVRWKLLAAEASNAPKSSRCPFVGWKQRPVGGETSLISCAGRQVAGEHVYRQLDGAGALRVMGVNHGNTP